MFEKNGNTKDDKLIKGEDDMTEETSNSKDEKENTNIIKANVGDVVQIKKGDEKGKKGKVVVLRENSVIVEIGISPTTGEPLKTVLNHKNYKLVK